MVVFAYIKKPLERPRISQHLRKKYVELYKKTKGTKVMFFRKRNGRLVYKDERSRGNMRNKITSSANVVNVTRYPDESKQLFFDLYCEDESS